MALVRRNGVEQHLHLHQLVGIEGVDPAGAPGRLPGEERLQPRAALDEAFAHLRYDDVPPNLLLDQTEVCPGRLYRGNELVRLQALVDAGVENEADEPVEVQVIRRHGAHDDALGSFRRAKSAGVADRAIEPDEIDAAEVALGNADGEVLLPAVTIGSVEKAEGTIVEMAVELGGKQSRQRFPHPERDAAALVGADRAVLEMGEDVGEGLGAVARQAFRRGEREADGDQRERQQQHEQDQQRKEQASAPAQLRFDVGDGRFGGRGHEILP
jgi:hypothetical protein